jgi:methylisocitrate lyase
MSAMIIADLGFPAVYIGGSVAQASMLGVPDASLHTITEISSFTRNVVGAIGDLPLIVDVDHGFGNAIVTRRTVVELEKAGAAGIHIEDHVKFSNHLLSKELMVDKLRAALDARKNKDFVIIARTDAPHLTSYDDAVDRIKAFERIGVDMVFPAGWDLKRIPELKKVVSIPIFRLARSGFSVNQMEKLGIKFIAFHNQAMLITYKAIKNLWQELKINGSIDSMMDKMGTRQEFREFIGVPKFQELTRKFKIE